MPPTKLVAILTFDAGGRVTYDKSQRLCIPHGLRDRLGVPAGADMVVRLDPENASVALAPLALVLSVLDLYEQARRLPLLPTVTGLGDNPEAAEVS